jgi:hypothetical protein
MRTPLRVVIVAALLTAAVHVETAEPILKA